MRIQNNKTAQSFNANPICRTVIKRNIPFTPFYTNAQATLVQLDRRYDLPALTKYASSHPKSALTTDCIFDLRADEHTRAFAITIQKTDFDELNPEEILGICDGRILHRNDKPIFYLQNLETQSANNPLAVHHKKNLELLGIEIPYKEKFKNIGRKLMLGLVRVVNNSEAEAIELKPFEHKKEFYKRLGFEQSAQLYDVFELQRKNFQDFICKN